MDSKIKEIKKDVLIASYLAGACHIGSALSCVATMVELFYGDKLKKNDIFLFGKASGVATYYAILADKRYFSKDATADYLRKYPLPSSEVPGVVHSFGSCGHALSVACGIALADRTRNVHVLLSDGECQEGSTHEAALFARQHELNNLYVYVDNNKLQACGRTDDILKVHWDFYREVLPNCEIVDTIKGDGVIEMEDKYEWHYKNLDGEKLEQAVRCLI